jgi:hypothetical protein
MHAFASQAQGDARAMNGIARLLVQTIENM